MSGIRDESEIEIGEYEEIIGNWDQISVREGAMNIQAVSIQEPTSTVPFYTHRATGPETNRRELCRRRKRVPFGGSQCY